MRKKLLYLVTLGIFAVCWSSCTSSSPKIKVQPVQGGEVLTLTDFQFYHPMTVTTADEIAEVKKRIANSTEPQASAYQALLAQAGKALDFVPDPPDTMFIMGGYEPGTNLWEMRAWLWRNCSAAYGSALAYAYGGETKYADKAVEVLNAWARAGTVFTGHDNALQVGSYFTPMLYAVDLLWDYPDWEPEDRLVFKTWWRNNCLSLTYDIMRTRFNNWKDAGLLGVMATAVVLEDVELLEESLNQFSNYFGTAPSKSRGEPEPDWKIRNDSLGVYLPHEVVRNDGSSGLIYTGYSMTSLIQCIEIARYVGYDFWTARTADGASMEGVINDFFRWMILEEYFPWNPNANRTNEGFRYNTFEIARNHVNLIPELSEWVKANRPVKGAQGDEFATLNKGDLTY